MLGAIGDGHRPICISRSVRSSSALCKECTALPMTYTPEHAPRRFFLAVEQRLTAVITEIVHGSEEMMCWLKWYLADWVEGSRDVPHLGAPFNTARYFRPSKR